MTLQSDARPRPKYEYTNLCKGQFRLLELLPQHEGLTGRIHHFTLPAKQDENTNMSQINVPLTRDIGADTPVYDALSHHWGLRPMDHTPTISILGKDDEVFEFDIREGLKDCLEVLLKTIKEERDVPQAEKKVCPYIWVDAICINQDSGPDKNVQLAKMGDVYNGARRVVVWLGQEANGSNLAMDFVEELQDLDDLPSFLQNCNQSVPLKWKAFAELTRRRWFTRLWIVQEISAAKEAYLMCGEKWLSWDDFAGAVSLFASQNDGIRQMLREAGEFAKHKDYLGEIHESGANKLVEAKSSVVRKRDNGTIAEHLLSLETLLMSLSSFEASEAHDVVYAILWLSSDARPEDQYHLAPRIHSYTLATPQGPLSPVLTPKAQVPDLTLEDPPGLSESLRALAGDAAVSRKRSGDPTLQPDRHTKHARGLSQQYLGVPATEVARRETAVAITTPAGGITVDYKADVYQTIAQVIQHVIEKYGTLDLITYPWAPPPQEQDRNAKPPRYQDEKPHPSWILPRTRRAFNVSPKKQLKVLSRVHADPLVGVPGARSYFACGKTKARKARIEDRCLVAPGWWLEELSEVGETANDAVIPVDWLELIKWTNAHKQPMPDWFWRTLVANRGPSGFGDPPPRFKTACLSMFRSAVEGANLNLPGLLTNGSLDPVTKEYADRVISVIFNRRLLIAKSSKGDGKILYGLGPKAARPGDRICILAGCSVPVLLRPQPIQSCAPPVRVNGTFQGQCYTFIGECYIDGMMNGEGFHYAEDRHRDMEDLYIV